MGVIEDKHKLRIEPSFTKEMKSNNQFTSTTSSKDSLNSKLIFKDPINLPREKTEKESNNQKRLENSEKLLKNKTLNTTKKYKLKILQQTSCVNAKCLNKLYSNENDIITFHFYSIEIVAKDKYVDGKLFSSKKGINSDKSFGIITQEYLGEIPNLKLLNPLVINEKAFNIEYVEIKYQKRRKLKKNSFNCFITFHQKLFEDLYLIKDSIPYDISRILVGDAEERRYLIAPIIRFENGWDFVKKL